MALHLPWLSRSYAACRSQRCAARTDDPWATFERTASRLSHPALLRQNVEHFTALIDRAPEVDELAVDLAEDLIQVPSVSGATPWAPKPAGILCSKGQTPKPDGLVRDIHAPLEHHLLNIAKAQAETKVEPHTVGNDLAREAIAAVDRTRSGIHTTIASSPAQVANAIGYDVSKYPPAKPEDTYSGGLLCHEYPFAPS